MLVESNDILLPSTTNVPLISVLSKFVVPVTPRVPPITVLPVADATVN